MLILAVKGNQLSVHRTEIELRILSPRTNRGATVFARLSLLEYSVVRLHAGRLVWCIQQRLHVIRRLCIIIGSIDYHITGYEGKECEWSAGKNPKNSIYFLKKVMKAIAIVGIFPCRSETYRCTKVCSRVRGCKTFFMWSNLRNSPPKKSPSCTKQSRWINECIWRNSHNRDQRSGR